MKPRNTSTYNYLHIQCSTLKQQQSELAKDNPSSWVSLGNLSYFYHIRIIAFNTTGNFRIETEHKLREFHISHQMTTLQGVPGVKVTTSGFNPLNPELNPICYLLALLGAHHFLHVSKIRVKSLTLRRLMSYIYIYIYMEHPFLMFLDHTRRRSTVGRTPLDE